MSGLASMPHAMPHENSSGPGESKDLSRRPGGQAQPEPNSVVETRMEYGCTIPGTPWDTQALDVKSPKSWVKFQLNALAPFTAKEGALSGLSRETRTVSQGPETEAITTSGGTSGNPGKRNWLGIGKEKEILHLSSNFVSRDRDQNLN
jgi:hypothetical protein